MLVRTAWFLILLLVQSTAYANVMGPAEVQKLYERVKTTLDNPTPEEPFYLKSENDKNIESGEAAFYLPLGMDQIADSLSSVQNWCEIMSLHINVKACTYNEKNSSITVYMGRKYYQSPDQAYDLTYDFKVIRNDGYFAAIAVAKKGPLGSSNYHIEVEVIAIDNKSFGRIYVSNQRSWISSAAMNIYLVTMGRNKQGIKVVGRDNQGNPMYSSGESGVAERNVLRYYFAFTAFFSEINEKNHHTRHEGQLAYWFDQTEQYPQLFEMSREEYLSDKRKERVNQIALQKSHQ